MFVIRNDDVRPVRPKELGGAVVYVRPCTVDQFVEVMYLPNVPTDPTTRLKVIAVLGRHIDNITGLAVEVGGEQREIRKVADVLDLCPPWVLMALYNAVLDASRLTPEELGNSARPSSGAESTAGSTVASVDLDG